MFRHEQIQSYLLYTPFVYSHVICVSFALGFCELKMHVRTGHLYNVTARDMSLYTRRVYDAHRNDPSSPQRTQNETVLYI